jgi:hypothetical protein
MQYTPTVASQPEVPETAKFICLLHAGYDCAPGKRRYMKTLRFAGLLLAFALMVGSGSAQQTELSTVQLPTGSKPELVDEITTVGNCEDGSRALHDFLISLANNPADEGHIIIYTEKSKLGGGLQRERQLRAAMKLFRGSYERVRIVRAALRHDAKTEFWRVPPGAVIHETEPLDLSGIPESAKPSSPYMYGMESFDGIAECKLYDYDVTSYADHLRQERKDRGRIIIRSTTRTRFLRKRRDILPTLSRGGVAAKRVDTVFVRADAGLISEAVELWVIPAKN